MDACFAPSELPGVSPTDASAFGHFAEELIYSDLCRTYPCGGGNVFQDHYNPAAYLYFLARHNPHFDATVQRDYFRVAASQRLAKIPDFLVHLAREKAFYEVKPQSPSGLRAGVDKVGKLSAVYRHYRLPYTPGMRFAPSDIRLAHLGSVVVVTLRVNRAGPGLLTYRVCVDAQGAVDAAALMALLAAITRALASRPFRGVFRPVDIGAFVRASKELAGLGRRLGLPMAVRATRRVRWGHFWKAVARRFGVRGSAALALSAADGPLPVGELLSVGLAIWTVIDIVRLSGELWNDAGRIAAEES